MYTYFGETCEELNITKADAEAMSCTGRSDDIVKALLPKYQKQLRKKSLDNLRQGIISSGIEAKRVNEMDEETVFEYVLWIASGNIIDEIYAKGR